VHDAVEMCGIERVANLRTVARLANMKTVETGGTLDLTGDVKGLSR
jgi:hypothetical protein